MTALEIMGNIWPYRRALYLHFLIKLPSVCVFCAHPCTFLKGLGGAGEYVARMGWDARHLELPPGPMALGAPPGLAGSA